jgi:ubiquinone/menaquinone biosynthesis C-methylase UbiE
VNNTKSNNVDINTVEGFGDEWERFDQTKLNAVERKRIFQLYFSIFPWNSLPVNAEGFDLGCGSGRWAKEVAPRVAKLHCIDPSSALAVARRNLANDGNCEFHEASVDAIPIADASMDFGYSLGVLHHVPDTRAGIAACVAKLKPGAPLLIYLYYAFDNKPLWFRLVWQVSDVLRQIISRLPHALRFAVSQILALLIYWPLARGAKVLEKLGFNVVNIPLSSYRNNSLYTMRTDALDRFGTRLEQRFSKKKIQEMMELAGLDRIQFSDGVPYWCAVGYKK